MFRPVPIGLFSVLTGLLFTQPLVGVATGDDWTTLKGRIVFDGEIPKPEPLDITRDEDVCGQFGLVDESLLVNEKNHGLKNAVIWLYLKKGEVPVHDSYTVLKEDAVHLDNTNCRFEPRIVTLRTGQVLRATNSDPVSHNVAVYARRNNPFSIVVPQNQPLERTFQKEELLPIRVDCSIHAWMKAHIVVTDHPYAVVTDDDGRFELKHVPAGKWQFRFWHERPGYVTRLTRGEEIFELERGVWEIDVQGEELNLGELTVDGAAFAEDE